MAFETIAGSRTSDILLLPIDVHVFEYADGYYAFDTRNYAILKVTAAIAAVLERAGQLTLSEIVEELRLQHSETDIQSAYLKILKLLAAGVLSSDPVPRPKRPPFQRLVLMLAGGCNMGCTYCFEKDVPIYQDLNLMSSERADEVLEWFFAHHEGDKAHLQLYGGEPTLNWPVLMHVIHRMETWASQNNIALSKYIITNGTLLNPDRIAFLKQHDVRVQVSADGDAETHNHFRIFKSGKPTMERILPNIRELAQQEVDFNLRAVLTRQSLDPERITDGLRSLGGKKVSFEVVASDCGDAQLGDREWDEFNELYGRYVDRPFTSWSEMPHEMQNMIIRICDSKRVFYGCGAGISEVTVAPDGAIYECQRIYREPYANVKDGRGPTELNSQFLTMVDDRPVCRDCWARYLCGGGCMQQSHVGHGTDEPLPQYCVMKRKLAEASIIKIHEIRTAHRAAPELQHEAAHAQAGVRADGN